MKLALALFCLTPLAWVLVWPAKCRARWWCLRFWPCCKHPEQP